MLRSGNEQSLNAKYIELENKVFETERLNISLNAQVDQEKKKNKKILNDFDQVTTMIKTNDSDSKAISDNSLQAMLIKNQKLEVKLT